MTSLLVALIGALGVLGAAQISRLGQVKKLVNGTLSRLIQEAEENAATIAAQKTELAVKDATIKELRERLHD